MTQIKNLHTKLHMQIPKSFYINGYRRFSHGFDSLHLLQTPKRLEIYVSGFSLTVAIDCRFFIL